MFKVVTFKKGNFIIQISERCRRSSSLNPRNILLISSNCELRHQTNHLRQRYLEESYESLCLYLRPFTYISPFMDEHFRRCQVSSKRRGFVLCIRRCENLECKMVSLYIC